MSEELQGSSQGPRMIVPDQTESFHREGFDGHFYVKPDENLGFSVLAVDVHGEHPRKKMLGDTTRTYFVIEGNGEFVLNDEVVSVSAGNLIVIPPDGEYSYFGEMRLLESNVSPGNEFKDEKISPTS